MNAYTLAKERYAALGIDTEAVLETLKNVPNGTTSSRWSINWRTTTIEI